MAENTTNNEQLYVQKEPFEYNGRTCYHRHIFLWTLFSGGDFAPLPALLRFMTSKGAFTIIFAPNSVNLRGVRVQGF